MKKLMGLLLLVGLICGWLLSREAGVQAQIERKLIVTPQGALINLLDTKGQSLFGALTRDGYTVRYQVRDRIVNASAIGINFIGLQGRQSEVNGQTIIVRAMTSDQALEITSYFLLQEEDRKLVIGRKYRNMSRTDSLTLLRAQESLDAKLLTDNPQASPMELTNRVMTAVRVGYLRPSSAGCGGGQSSVCPVCDCPPPPPCPTRDDCSLVNKFRPLQFLPILQSIELAPTILLEWPGTEILPPASLVALPSAGTGVQKNEAFIVRHIYLP